MRISAENKTKDEIQSFPKLSWYNFGILCIYLFVRVKKYVFPKICNELLDCNLVRASSFGR